LKLFSQAVTLASAPVRSPDFAAQAGRRHAIDASPARRIFVRGGRNPIV
jgi:hypothetical protein